MTIRIEWLSIETAPKDGSVILVACVQDGVCFTPDFARWNENKQRWDNGENYQTWNVTHWVSLGLPDGSKSLTGIS